MAVCTTRCYICGEYAGDTLDAVGCLNDQKDAAKRFEEKHGEEPEAWLRVCSDCRDENPHHARNTETKYGTIVEPWGGEAGYRGRIVKESEDEVEIYIMASDDPQDGQKLYNLGDRLERRNVEVDLYEIAEGVEERENFQKRGR